MPYNDKGYHLCEDCYREGKRDVLATHTRGHGFAMSFFCALHAAREVDAALQKPAKGEEVSAYDAMCLDREALSDGAWILFRNFDPYLLTLSRHCTALICCAKLSTVESLRSAAPPNARWDCGFISSNAIRSYFPHALLLNGEALLTALTAKEP